MRPFDGVLLVEGETTPDGQTVAEGAISWPPVVPIFDAARERVLGHAYGVGREGLEIRAVGSVALPPGEYPVAARILVEAGTEAVVVAGRLLDAALVLDGAEPSFAAARIVVYRDEIDARVTDAIHAGIRDAYVPDRKDD